jgi:hypothetical protein
MKNWKTTVAGIVLSIGGSLQLSDDSTVKSVGAILVGIGGLFLGLFAKQYNVTGGTIQQDGGTVPENQVLQDKAEQ